eukprot:192134-Alexandrium_andersonii.AAC.1
MPTDDAARGPLREPSFSGRGGGSPLGVTGRGGVRRRPNSDRGHGPQGARTSLAKDALDGAQEVLAL